MGLYGKWQWFLRTVPASPRNFAITFAEPSFFYRWWKVKSNTMLPYGRLKALYEAVALVEAEAIEGDIVECGTARGGSLAMLAQARHRFCSINREIWAFDTYVGIPSPTAADPDYEMARNYTGKFKGTIDEVAALLRRVGAGESVRLVKGLFQETLPCSAVSTIAILHLDGDWYESTRCCLDNLWDRLAPGAIVQIDDYGCWAGARKATDEFFSCRGLEARLKVVDADACQVRKQ
jgi:hypothetical protein